MSHFALLPISAEQIHGLWLCLTLALSVAAVCPLLCLALRDFGIRDRAA